MKRPDWLKCLWGFLFMIYYNVLFIMHFRIKLTKSMLILAHATYMLKLHKRDF